MNVFARKLTVKTAEILGCAVAAGGTIALLGNPITLAAGGITAVVVGTAAVVGVTTKVATDMSGDIANAACDGLDMIGAIGVRIGEALGNAGTSIGTAVKSVHFERQSRTEQPRERGRFAKAGKAEKTEKVETETLETPEMAAAGA